MEKRLDFLVNFENPLSEISMLVKKFIRRKMVKLKTISHFNKNFDVSVKRNVFCGKF